MFSPLTSDVLTRSIGSAPHNVSPSTTAGTANGVHRQQSPNSLSLATSGFLFPQSAASNGIAGGSSVAIPPGSAGVGSGVPLPVSVQPSSPWTTPSANPLLQQTAHSHSRHNSSASVPTLQHPYSSNRLNSHCTADNRVIAASVTTAATVTAAVEVVETSASSARPFIARDESGSELGWLPIPVGRRPAQRKPVIDWRIVSHDRLNAMTSTFLTRISLQNLV